MKSTLLAVGVGFAAATSIEVISSDLNGGNRVVDNVKAKWSQTLKFLGNDATLQAEYDRNAKERGLSEATLTGKNGDVNFELKTHFDNNDLELTASTDTKDGTTLEVVANRNDGVKSLSASRPWNIQGQDCEVQATHTPAGRDTKLKLSSVLGHGVRAVAEYTVGNQANVDYELEYEADISEGRHVSANLKPQQNSGEIEYVDTKTIDATLTASMDLNGKPKVTVKRSWDF
jgi:hypothetical protein